MAVYAFALENVPFVLWATLSLLVLYPFLVALYNLTLHSLSSYPGPLLWRASRLPYMRSVWSGWLHRDVQSIHRKYGSVVRIAPNELSFSDPQAWKDIYSNRGKTSAFPKSEVWNAPQPGLGVMLINALDDELHARMKKTMEGGFTEKAVAKQEGIVRGYVDLLIERLRENVRTAGPEDAGEAIVDIVKWLSFTTVDIVGDLAFGESFGCLETGEMSEWVGLACGSIKAQTLGAMLRHYTWLNSIVMRLVPNSAKALIEKLWALVHEKVDKRLQTNTKHPDFLSLWQMQTKKGTEGLERSEIYSNAFLVVVAGSETTATTLSGTVNHLVKNPNKLAHLAEEIRVRFDKEEDLTFAALKELTYLNAVIWEGLRMCNPIPVGLIRQTPPEGGMVCGSRIPGNMLVNMHPLTLFLNERHFFEATSFHPERWLSASVENLKSPFYNDDRAAVQPFSIGPRSCMGKPLALAESRLILARLVLAFDIVEADTEAGRLVWEDQKTFTAVEKQPFEVKLVPRKYVETSERL